MKNSIQRKPNKFGLISYGSNDMFGLFLKMQERRGNYTELVTVLKRVEARLHFHDNQLSYITPKVSIRNCIS